MGKKEKAAALILRLFLGLTFFIHGFSKFQGGISQTEKFFESLGLPGFLGIVTAVIELAGGIAVILGLGTRLVSALFALLMLGAIVKVKLNSGFMGGYEFELALFVISVYFIFANQSLPALDRVIFRSKNADQDEKVSA
ncbi:DoxX family protein [Scopulibacillus daqui]|uniref:DoxX family protein n=1 Tax=Scopulibacillus daqui TaxID=1469162 RepID=UPI0035E57E00